MGKAEVITSARRIRLAAGLSQEKLAKKADVSTGTVKNLERGEGIHVRNAIKIAEVLGVTLDALLDPAEVAS